MGVWSFQANKLPKDVYPPAYSDGWEAETSLARFLWRLCHVMPRSSLGVRTPHKVYRAPQK
jgi:putative transposase